MQLLMVSEVAKILRISRNDVYTLIKVGHLQAIKLGALKVPTDEVGRFIEENLGKEFTEFTDVGELKIS